MDLLLLHPHPPSRVLQSTPGLMLNAVSVSYSVGRVPSHWAPGTPQTCQVKPLPDSDCLVSVACPRAGLPLEILLYLYT